MGNGSQDEVVIRCELSAGLAFLWSQNIELRNISLVECGALQIINIINKPDYELYYQFQIAVFFRSCKVTKLTNVQITSSNGIGAVVYNPVGVINITSCLFSLLDGGDQEGEAGLVIMVNEVTSQSSCITPPSLKTVITFIREELELE